MNLGLAWVDHLKAAGYEAVHWSMAGAPDDSDDKIMQWARDNDHVILTADLDFGTMLVRGGQSRPSVVQLRTEKETLVRRIGSTVVAVITDTEADLSVGALVTIETERYRVRRLGDLL
jgi:predicted nuclease of predicted toxin-antitoxin system